MTSSKHDDLTAGSPHRSLPAPRGELILSFAMNSMNSAVGGATTRAPARGSARHHIFSRPVNFRAVIFYSRPHPMKTKSALAPRSYVSDSGLFLSVHVRFS